ncbi:CRISPR-associated protein [Hyella patelloides LEGE 07179]|uniref:CRISPR-associated protein n=1 Tax=Hyella patelloides LEGE 07179 TaxID=945734 RepID=A0A563VZ92_9CYAN|nr:type III-B CRISPR-associated protein Cas10/Cmr2 [Hyella patelloides]VEP16583.1 CRISPR-associated protein [Hyella patelloides LEGE 07179]
MGTYTVVTFSPVQEFIEKSRKLRDLYGSSFIVSYLAYFLAQAAEARQIEVISPGLLNVARGTPNYIIFEGDFPEQEAYEAFYEAWGRIVTICRKWLEEKFPERKYSWKRHWSNWKNHAWEFFWGQSCISISEAQQDLQDRKYQRAWIGINWEGDSSTLSGADAIAFPEMQQSNPKISNYQSLKGKIKQYYQDLSSRISEAIIDPSEFLSIPELVKRLITLNEIANRIDSNQELETKSLAGYIRSALENTSIDKLSGFKEINRFETQQWSGWFLGDGDRMGGYLKDKSQELSETEEKEWRNSFSTALMSWGENTFRPAIESNQEEASIGRLVYAGGDDFMGVFVPQCSSQPLTGARCWKWWRDFNEDIWKQHGYGNDVTVSVGFVWANHAVPQREILQHCNEAERTAKNSGRNRLAIRILFNSGNYLEWSCPWWFLSRMDISKENWVKMYGDIAHLEARHAFSDENTTVAKGIFQVYFNTDALDFRDDLWNEGLKAGILGERSNYLDKISGLLDRLKVNRALNDWVINLAKVGFHLFHHE